MNKKLPVVAAVAAFTMLTVPTNVFASNTKTAQIKASIDETLSIVLSANDISFDLSDMDFHKDTITVTGKTNNAAGYTISFNANNEYNDLKHNNPAVDFKIASIEDDVAETSFPAASWGFSVDDTASAQTFKQIPLESQKIFETSTMGSADHEFTAGIKSSASLVAGDYENELLFTIVANPASDSGVTAMQSMTPELCASLPLEEQMQFVDLRDNKLYWIARLADGKCWMTQNLDYNLDSSVALTPEDSDVTESWTPVNSTIPQNRFSADWRNSNSAPYSLDLNDRYYEDVYSVQSTACGQLDFPDCEHESDTPYASNGEHGHIGNFYNWTAAVAMNDSSSLDVNGYDAPNSICPKGWRLPHGYESSIGSDFDDLMTAYDANRNRTDEFAMTAPIYLTRTGHITNGFHNNNSKTGFYWTSTVRAASVADRLASGYDGVWSFDETRYYGYTIRCVAK